MQLRPYAPADASVVAGWADDTDTRLWCGRDEVTAETVEEWVAEPDTIAYGLEVDGELVGYGELWPEDDEPEVEIARLVVAPAHRGHGVGQALVTELVRAGRAHRDDVVLRVHPDNTRALRSYEGVGFVPLDPAEAAEWNKSQPLDYLWLRHRPRRNWAGNVAYGARRVHRPASVDELRRLVAGRERIRALGTAHSFSLVADAPGDLVDTTGLPAEPVLDGDTVTVGAGLRYGELGAFLHERGLALPNLASLPHLSVGGACATGTHGSGTGSLATAVAALEIVTASGDLVTLRRGDPDFAGAVVGLGLLGVVVRVTLDVRPAVDVRQYVYDDLPSLDLAVLDEGYSVSIFTDWRGGNSVWRKVLAPVDPGPFHGARPADGPRHPVPGVPPETCTEQLGVPGPWHERLPHFRLDHTPSVGHELQAEFLLPRPRAAAALDALRPLAGRIADVLLISELRSVAADDLWLSMAYGRDSVALHFTFQPDAAAVLPVLDAVEDALAPFDPRPHWGKLSRFDPDRLERVYPRLPDFRALVRRWDPAGTFRNDLTDRALSLR